MPAGRFKEGQEATMPADAYREVLERAINRGLILEQALAQGVELGETELKQLDATYGHLTSNPLHVAGEGTPVDLNVGGKAEDMMFHVREQAARLLQLELLKKYGLTDTAEGREELIKKLRGGVTIQTAEVNL